MREEAGHRKALEIETEVAAAYRQTNRRIQDEIEVFYSRYMNKYGASYAEAVKDLTLTEREDWLAAHRERIERINARVPGWEKLMQQHDADSFGARITRLQARQAEIDLEVTELQISATQRLREGLGDIYKDGFYKSSFDLQQGTGLGQHIGQVDDATLRQVLDYPWSGANFSERIWRNTEQLKVELKNTLSQGLTRGDSVDVMARKLAKRMDVSHSAAKRIIATESANIHGQAQLAAYEKAGIEEYQLLATLDKRTSAICQEMDKKVFKVADAAVGENYPPFHPWCRTTTVAYFGESTGGTRAARDEHGKTIQVPEDMTYQEWYTEFVTKPKAAKTLTEEEAGALSRYTGGEAYVLNAKMRAGMALNETEQQLLNWIVSGLEKMPRHEGTVYRSITTDFAELEEIQKQYTPGEFRFEPTLFSTSKGVYDASMPVQFVIESKNGRDITAYNEAELEVLFLPDTEFYVEKVIHKDGKLVIHMKEE